MSYASFAFDKSQKDISECVYLYVSSKCRLAGYASTIWILNLFIHIHDVVVNMETHQWFVQPLSPLRYGATSSRKDATKIDYTQQVMSFANKVKLFNILVTKLVCRHLFYVWSVTTFFPTGRIIAFMVVAFCALLCGVEDLHFARAITYDKYCTSIVLWVESVYVNIDELNAGCYVKTIIVLKCATFVYIY